MLRFGNGPQPALDQSRAFSRSIRTFAGDRHASSSIMATATAAVFAAFIVVVAPSFGPVVEQHVFSRLSDIPPGSSQIGVAETGKKLHQLALSTPRPPVHRPSHGPIHRPDRTAAMDDGSPSATGSISRNTRAAREAARVIADMVDTPSRNSGIAGLRGSLDMDDPE